MHSKDAPNGAPTPSKIFVRNATVLDCAVLDSRVGPRGRSWYVDILWEGSTNAEGVVFDFSWAKKAAKDVIDAEFDHRLIVGKKHVRRVAGVQREDCPGAGLAQGLSDGSNGRAPVSDRCIVTSPFVLTGSETPEGAPARFEVESVFALDTHADALAIVDDALLEALERSGNTAPLGDHIAARVHAASPDNVTRVQVRLREHEQKSEPHFFTYTHSLRQHYGNCQRFHGHSNVVEALRDGEVDMGLSAALARALDGRYLIPPCYLVDGPDAPAFALLRAACPDLLTRGDLAWVRYVGSQGPFALALPRTAVWEMESESTIENIARVLHERFAPDEDVVVAAYEGLAKGALSP